MKLHKSHRYLSENPKTHRSEIGTKVFSIPSMIMPKVYLGPVQRI
jgi:hypothetical protein